MPVLGHLTQCCGDVVFSFRDRAIHRLRYAPGGGFTIGKPYGRIIYRCPIVRKFTQRPSHRPLNRSRRGPSVWTCGVRMLRVISALLCDVMFYTFLAGGQLFFAQFVFLFPKRSPTPPNRGFRRTRL